jgi:GTP-binding protein Era
MTASENTKQFCGYIALIGLPNAGKSTLLNSCIQAKIAGVSKRPNTTRNRILGVETIAAHQLIFVDTPGIQGQGGKATKSQLNRAMQGQVWATLGEADVVCYLMDVARGWTPEDAAEIKRIISQLKRPLWVIASKADALKKPLLKIKVAELQTGMAALLQELDAREIGQCFKSAEPYVLSAKRPEEVQQFKSELAALLPENPWLFAADSITDASEQFILAELIREQLFRKLADEIPFGCGVMIDKVVEGATLKIYATIIVDNPSHKKIVIGKGGEALKVIGSLARENIEHYFDGRKVYLELYVRVEKGWTQQQLLVQQVQKIE